MSDKTIGFIGLGKLGLDCAEVFATKYQVVGFDIYPRQSDSVVILDSIADVVKVSDWIFIAVPTPHDKNYDGSVPSSHMPPRDFGHDDVTKVLTSINLACQQSQLQDKRIVLISTVLPGTTREKFCSLLDQGQKFFYNPYLIAMGSVKWDMANPEMVIIGNSDGDPAGCAELIDLYRPIMENDPRYVTGTYEECESIKIFYNTFISAKVGLVNMIQDFAMKIGHMNVDVVTEALAHSNIRIMGPKYMTAGMGDAGACHPRDNIALRWLAKKYDLGYDLFDAVMTSREVQARNLAAFLVDQARSNDLPIVIHGKAYKPDVPYCIGSYSTLVGHFVKQLGLDVVYVDPLADDETDVVRGIDTAAVILMAHNRRITYGYTGDSGQDVDYFVFKRGSIIVDPWRRMPQRSGMTVIHYGNSRDQ
jgi:UDPglucose 6-dehydrogenase